MQWKLQLSEMSVLKHLFRIQKGARKAQSSQYRQQQMDELRCGHFIHGWSPQTLLLLMCRSWQILISSNGLEKGAGKAGGKQKHWASQIKETEKVKPQKKEVWQNNKSTSRVLPSATVPMEAVSDVHEDASSRRCSVQCNLFKKAESRDYNGERLPFKTMSVLKSFEA